MSEGMSLALTGPLTLETVTEISRDLSSKLETARESSQPLLVELQDVTQFDLSGLQLLYSFIITAESAGVSLSFSWGDIGERLNKMCRFAGLKPIAEGQVGGKR